MRIHHCLCAVYGSDWIAEDQTCKARQLKHTGAGYLHDISNNRLELSPSALNISHNFVELALIHLECRERHGVGDLKSITDHNDPDMNFIPLMGYPIGEIKFNT